MYDTIGYQWIDFHVMFYVNTNFHRKYCCVARGHQIDPPSSMNYSSIVFLESVRI